MSKEDSEIKPAQQIIDLNRFIRLCSKHNLNLSPEELILLLLLKTEDVANIYRFAFEVPMRANKHTIDHTIFRNLEEKGLVQIRPGYDPKHDSLVDKYDIVSDIVNQLFLDIDQAVDELISVFPVSITSSDGQTIITRNIEREELVQKYSRIVGFISEDVDPSYLNAVPSGSKNVRHKGRALKLVDAAMHKKVLDGIVSYKVEAESGKTHAIGLVKFLDNKVWEGFSEHSRNTYDSSEDI